MPDEPITPAADPVPEPAPASDPAPVADPVTPEPAAPPAGPDFHKVIGADGKLLDGWKDTLPEDIRHELSLDTFQDLPGAIKQLVNAQKLIGKNKIAIPGKDAPASEVEAFQIALGRPNTIEEYEVKIPEGQEEYFDETLIGTAKELIFKHGGNQALLNDLITFRAMEIAEGQKALEAQDEAEYQAAEKIVAAEAGEAWDDQKHFANKLIADECNPEHKEKLLEAINDHSLRPYLFNFLANIERKYKSEHEGVVPGQNPQGGAMTPAMLKTKANELEMTTGYADGTMKNNNPVGYKALTEQITELYSRIDKAEKAAQKQQ